MRLKLSNVSLNSSCNFWLVHLFKTCFILTLTLKGCDKGEKKNKKGISLFGDFGLDLWSRTINNLEEFSKSNLLQDYI